MDYLLQFWKYTIGSALGIIPGVCLYVSIGRLAGDIAQVSSGNMDDNNPVILFTTVGISILILVILVAVLTRFEAHKPLGMIYVCIIQVFIHGCPCSIALAPWGYTRFLFVFPTTAQLAGMLRRL